MSYTPEHPLKSAELAVGFCRRRAEALREKIRRSGLPDSRTQEWIGELGDLDELLTELEGLLQALRGAYPDLLREPETASAVAILDEISARRTP